MIQKDYRNLCEGENQDVEKPYVLWSFFKTIANVLFISISILRSISTVKATTIDTVHNMITE